MKRIRLLNKDNNVLKAGLGYTIGNYLLKGLGFLTVPLFSRMMSTADFGMYNTFLSYESVLYLFICLAIHSSIKNAKYDFPGKLDEYVSSILLIPCGIALILLFLVNVFTGLFTNVLGMGRALLNLLVLMSFASGVLILYQSRLAIDYRSREYLALSYANAIGSIILSTLLIVLQDEEKYIGRIIGTVLPVLFIAVWVMIRLFRTARPTINKEYYSFGLKISIPIIPHGLGQVVLTSFDRVMITSMIGASASGIYSFAYTIGALVQVTGNSISTVLEPWVFERIDSGEIGKAKKYCGIYYLFLVALTCGVMLFSPELIYILGSEKYNEAFGAVLPVLFAGMISMAYAIPAIVEYYFKKTGYIAIGTCGAAIVNILLNVIFIPKYGFVAAAYTTLASYMLYFIFHMISAKRISGFNLLSPILAGVGFLCTGIVMIVTLLTREYVLARLSFSGIVIVIFASLLIKNRRMLQVWMKK